MRKGQKATEEMKKKISNSLKGRRSSMATEFKKGNIPWNTGTKGVMKANKSSFGKGHMPSNYMGGFKLAHGCIYKRAGNYKSGNPKYESLARVKWREKFGEIPKGMIIFHKDGDELNNEIDNLILITRTELFIRNKKKYKKEKRCAICGLKFLARHSRHKNCSKKCMGEYGRIISSEYKKNHVKKEKKYQKEYHREYYNRPEIRVKRKEYFKEHYKKHKKEKEKLPLINETNKPKHLNT